MFATHKLAKEIDEFLVFKRACGCPYHRGEFMLRSFERFVQQHTERGSRVELPAMVSGWLSRAADRKPVTVTLELGVMRQFCLFRRRHHPRGFVPSREWAPQPAKSVFLPHIFSRDEVLQILEAAGKHRGKNLWSGLLRTLILIVYCTGLRLGEAVRLRLTDVDLERQFFLVRESKGKTRIVPFRTDLARALKAYLDERESVATVASDGAFLIRLSGKPLPVGVASNAITRLLRKLGLKPSSGRVGPRPYDFRHTFAVHRLTDWYQHGVDIHARLPWLSAYMGHDNVLGTEVYLTATPQLMAIASDRFEKRLHRSDRKR